jgi:hypothetical protein
MSRQAYDLLRIDEIVDELNIGIYEQIEDGEITINLISNGNHLVIEFLNCHIWNSEDDSREYIDEENDIKEDFHNFLKKEINKKIEMLSNIKL